MRLSISYVAATLAVAVLAGCSGAGAGGGSGADGPVAVTGVYTGRDHTLVLLEDGTLWTAGRNSDGQLGDGSTTDRFSLVLVMNDVASVSGGWSHTLVVRRDGSLWGFGSAANGRLGLGSSAPADRRQLEPVRIAIDGAVRHAAAGGSHSLVIMTDGRTFAFGSNSNGQLGTASVGVGGFTTTPVQITALGTNARSAYAGGLHSAIIDRNGALWVFGSNSNSQLGLSGSTDRAEPVQLTATPRVAGASLGWQHTFYWTVDGDLYAVGENDDGQLGDGTTTQRNVAGSPVMTGVETMSAGRGVSTAVVKTDGTLWTFGRNNAGQLGFFSTSTPRRQLSPRRVLDDVSGAAAGGNHVMILRRDGTVWGSGVGNRGDGTRFAISQFRAINGPPPAIGR